MKFETYVYTNKGGRMHNEDFVDYMEEAQKGAWIIADGLGGHACGEVAAQIAAREILRVYKETSLPCLKCVEEAINRANQFILAVQKEYPDKRKMRTTVVTALTDGQKLYIGNIGDSRLYYFRQGKLLYVTPDHSVSYKTYLAKEIPYEAIRNHEDRSKLLRVLGEEKKYAIGKKAIEIQVGDAFLLCSDGFWEYIYELELMNDLSKSYTTEEWITHLLIRLMNRVDGNHDNYSVIGVWVRE